MKNVNSYSVTQLLLPNICYHTLDIILITDSDAAYHVLPKSRSRVAANLYFTTGMPDYAKVTPTPNGPILTTCETLRNVVSSAAEAETGGTFKCVQHAIPIKRILENVFQNPQPTKGSHGTELERNQNGTGIEAE